jgi:hypothetical protein
MTLRRALAVVLCLLLLSLQSQALVHPLSHLGSQPKLQDTTLTSTHGDETCVECPLLAGGLTTVLAASSPVAFDTAPGVLVFHSYRSRTAEVPAWFQSRAPPTLL